MGTSSAIGVVSTDESAVIRRTKLYQQFDQNKTPSENTYDEQYSHKQKEQQSEIS
jgi:hypothetical protein